MSYFEYFKSVLSWHYFVEAGEIFQAAVAKPIDGLIDAAKQAVIQRFWKYCEDDALPYLLQNYNLDRVEAFTADKSRLQVGDAWDTWEKAGSELGILDEVRRLGYTASMIPVWQYRQSSDGVTDTITIQPTLRPDINNLFWPKLGMFPIPAPPWSFTQDIATQGAFTDGWWVDLNFHASSFWIVLNDAPFAFRKWGDRGRWGEFNWDALVTGSRVDLQRLYTTIRKFTPPEYSCRGIVFSYSGRYFLAHVLAGIAVRSTYDAWTVGSGGYSARWNGYQWTPVATGTTANLTAVVVDDARAQAVGAGGAILRWDNGAWVPETSGTAAQLNSACYAGSDRWAVGAGGIILRNDGTGWASFTSPVATDLYSVYAIGPANVWAVGAGGVSIQWNGTTWTTQATGTTGALNGVWGVEVSAVWAVGLGGVILKWDGAAWSAETSPTTEDLFAIAGEFIKNKDGTTTTKVLATGDALVAYNGAAWALAPSDLGSRGLSIGGTIADNFWICTFTGQIFNLTNDGAVYSGNPWDSFTWDDGTRYNLKYVIKHMREGWEL